MEQYKKPDSLVPAAQTGVSSSSPRAYSSRPTSPFGNGLDPTTPSFSNNSRLGREPNRTASGMTGNETVSGSAYSNNYKEPGEGFDGKPLFPTEPRTAFGGDNKTGSYYGAQNRNQPELQPGQAGFVSSLRSSDVQNPDGSYSAGKQLNANTPVDGTPQYLRGPGLTSSLVGQANTAGKQNSFGDGIAGSEYYMSGAYKNAANSGYPAQNSIASAGGMRTASYAPSQKIVGEEPRTFLQSSAPPQSLDSFESDARSTLLGTGSADAQTGRRYTITNPSAFGTPSAQQNNFNAIGLGYNTNAQPVETTNDVFAKPFELQDKYKSPLNKTEEPWYKRLTGSFNSEV